MSDLLFTYDEETVIGAKILVVGVGGAGGNAVDHMVRADIAGVEFAAINTDAQALSTNAAPCRMQIGRNVTRGQGAGAKPEKAVEAVKENEQDLRNLVKGMDMVFITAGMGGGTGTGAAPEIARLAKEAGALTVGVVTLPFDFERSVRRRRADLGIENLREHVDTLIVIPNQRLMGIVDQRTHLKDAFKIVDDVLKNAVRGISDLITIPGLINLDFADVREVMKLKGDALMGVGTGTGEHAAQVAAETAISSPLLENCSIQGAKKLLVNITGGEQVSLVDVHVATQAIMGAVGEEAEVFLGAVTDPTLQDEVIVTVIATGIDPAAHQESPIFIEKQPLVRTRIPVTPLAVSPHGTNPPNPTPVQMLTPRPVEATQVHVAAPSTQGPQTTGALNLQTDMLQTQSLSSNPKPVRTRPVSLPTAARETLPHANLVINWDDTQERMQVSGAAALEPQAISQVAAQAAPVNLPPRENLEMPTFLRRTMD
jgi:cell division protein FtsZ